MNALHPSLGATCNVGLFNTSLVYRHNQSMQLLYRTGDSVLFFSLLVRPVRRLFSALK